MMFMTSWGVISGVTFTPTVFGSSSSAGSQKSKNFCKDETCGQNAFDMIVTAITISPIFTITYHHSHLHLQHINGLLVAIVPRSDSLHLSIFKKEMLVKKTSSTCCSKLISTTAISNSGPSSRLKKVRMVKVFFKKPGKSVQSIVDG